MKHQAFITFLLQVANSLRFHYEPFSKEVKHLVFNNLEINYTFRELLFFCQKHFIDSKALLVTDLQIVRNSILTLKIDSQLTCLLTTTQFTFCHLITFNVIICLSVPKPILISKRIVQSSVWTLTTYTWNGLISPTLKMLQF